MSYDRLSPLDSSFLHVEDGVTHMHIGSVLILEGPPPPYRDLCAMVASKLPLLPRYRQIIRTVPLDLGRPVWVDDPYFDISFHLRRSALPSPGDESELYSLVGHLMAQRLDRGKPLWEIWMVEGLAEDKWAIISKVHHCMVDGVAGSDLLGLVLDPTPTPLIPQSPPWVPAPAPAGWELAVEAVTDLVSSPFELARLARAQTRVPRRAWAEVAEILATVGGAVGSVRGPGTRSLNGPIGPHRRWAATSVPVADVKAVRLRAGGTFNDVVLAAITRGFRDLLAERGEPLEHPIRTLVPVSTRARDARGRAVGDGSLANQVSGFVADLPVHMDDPVVRLRTISEQMAGVKDSNQAVAGKILTSLSGFAPPMLLSLAGRLGTKVSQHSINTVTTNVPGPQLPLYAAGRRMLHAFPYVPVGLQVRISVAIFSYDGEVTFGVTGDYDSSRDIGTLTDGIRHGVAELQAADLGADVVDLRRATSHREVSVK